MQKHDFKDRNTSIRRLFRDFGYSFFNYRGNELSTCWEKCA